MPKKKNKPILLSIEEWGRSEATTFTGFCKKHDMETFRAIENNAFDKSNKHVFLYTYRNWAFAFHVKKEKNSMLSSMCQARNIYHNSNLTNTINDSNLTNIIKASEVAVNDLQYYKELFDTCIKNDSYEILTSFIWEFQFPVKFAASGVFVPGYDFSRVKIQEIHDLQCPAKHIFVEVFPEGEKSYCILSWLKEDDKIFNSYRASLKEFNEKQIKNYMNNLIQIHMDNIVINPSAFEKQSKHAKDSFLALVWGVHMLSGVDPSEEACMMLDETTLDLFSL